MAYSFSLSVLIIAFFADNVFLKNNFIPFSSASGLKKLYINSVCSFISVSETNTCVIFASIFDIFIISLIRFSIRSPLF